jgi:hypothetical protein
VSRAVLLMVFVAALASIDGCRSRADLPTSVLASDCLLGSIVSPASAALHVGDTLRVSVSTRICPGQPEQTLAPYAWSSSDSSVAKVSASSGLVLAIRDGNVTIVATSVEEPLIKGAMALHIAP